MPQVAAIAAQAIPGIIGAFTGNRAQNRFQGGQTNNLNFLDQFFQQLQGMLGPILDPARAAATGLTENSGFTQEMGNQNRRLGQFFGDIPGRVDQGLTGPLGLPPEIQQTINTFRQEQSFARDRNKEIVGAGGRTPEAGQIFDRAADLGNLNIPSLKFAEERSQEVLQLGGRNPELNFLRDRAQDLFRQDPQLAEASRAGLDIINAGGRTPENTRALQSFQDIVDRGGQTSQTRELFGLGTDLVRRGGFTPGLNNILGNVQGQISQGGLTPEARRLLEPLIETVENRGQGGALLPFDTAVSFARDQAIGRSRQAAEGARSRAFQRGGGGAGIVASGLQNQALAEFADESLRAESQAVQQAAESQQRLQLTQFLGAAGAGAQITGQAAQLLGQLNATQGDIARAASSNLASGAGLAQGSQAIAAQNLRTGQAGVGNTLQNILGNLQAGGNIFNQAQGQQLGRFELGGRLGLGVEDLVNQRIQGANTNLRGLGNLRLGGLELAGRLGQGFAGRVDESLGRLGDQNALDINLLNQQRGFRGQNIDATIQGLGLQGDILGQRGNLAIAGGRNVSSGANILANLLSTIFGGFNNVMNNRTRTLGLGGQGPGGIFNAQNSAGAIGGSINAILGSIFNRNGQGADQGFGDPGFGGSPSGIGGDQLDFFGSSGIVRSPFDTSTGDSFGKGLAPIRAPDPATNIPPPSGGFSFNPLGSGSLLG